MDKMDLEWKVDYDKEHGSGITNHLLVHGTKWIARVHRKIYTNIFYAQIYPMHIEKEFGSLDEAKCFAEDCARQCRFEWATN